MQHCVTYDGEHENEYGTLIVAELMSRTIFEWIKDLEIIDEFKLVDGDINDFETETQYIKRFCKIRQIGRAHV